MKFEIKVIIIAALLTLIIAGYVCIFYFLPYIDRDYPRERQYEWQYGNTNIIFVNEFRDISNSKFTIYEMCYDSSCYILVDKHNQGITIVKK